MTGPRISAIAGDDPAAIADRAVALLKREGVVVIDDLVDRARMAECRKHIEHAYPNLADRDRARNYGPYEGRHTMPMRIEGALGDRAIFLPPLIEAIAGQLLSETFLIDSLGLLVAVPGAPDQKRHPDGTLYHPEIDRLLPPFAIAFALPLVTMDETSGRTAFWRGSHRRAATAADHDYAPVVAPGSAILWDFRTVHCGLANRGDRPRPVIFSVLSREWWVEIHPSEAVLYEKLQLARSTRESMQPRLQLRLKRAKLLD